MEGAESKVITHTHAQKHTLLVLGNAFRRVFDYKNMHFALVEEQNNSPCSFLTIQPRGVQCLYSVNHYIRIETRPQIHALLLNFSANDPSKYEAPDFVAGGHDL